MKKIIVTGLIITASIISFFTGFYFVSQDGEFTKWGHSSLEEEHFKDGKAFYIDYLFRWEGIGSPEIEKIEFFQTDGTTVGEDEEFRVHPYIASSERGMFDEESAIKEGIIDDLIAVEGFKVDENLVLVLRVERASADKDISVIRITYKKYGVTQFQNIPFDEGVVSDEEAV